MISLLNESYMIISYNKDIIKKESETGAHLKIVQVKQAIIK